MTSANYQDLIELADRVFKIIEAIKSIQIKIEEVNIKFKGVTIGGHSMEDLNV